MKPDRPTPSQTVGPFFGFALPFEDDSDTTVGGGGGRVRIEGRLVDGAGAPVAEGLIELFDGEQFARCRTDPEGAFHFTVRPPQARDGMQAHFKVLVFARGLLRHLYTRMYFPLPSGAIPTDPALDLVEPDRRHLLVARDEGGVYRFDIRLQGESETVFFALPER